MLHKQLSMIMPSRKTNDLKKFTDGYMHTDKRSEFQFKFGKTRIQQNDSYAMEYLTFISRTTIIEYRCFTQALYTSVYIYLNELSYSCLKSTPSLPRLEYSNTIAEDQLLLAYTMRSGIVGVKQWHLTRKKIHQRLHMYFVGELWYNAV